MSYDDEDEDDTLEAGNVLDPQAGGRPRLCSRMCDTCVFAKGNPADLRPGRLREMIRLTLNAGSFIPCHETIRRDDGFRPAICRGFFDLHGFRSNVIRVWSRLGAEPFYEVDPPGVRTQPKETSDASDQALRGR